MAREVYQVPALTLFEDLLEALAGGAVLEHPHLDGKPVDLGQLFYQLHELVTFASQRERRHIRGQAEDRQHAQAILDGLWTCGGLLTPYLEDQAHIA